VGGVGFGLVKRRVVGRTGAGAGAVATGATLRAVLARTGAAAGALRGVVT